MPPKEYMSKMTPKCEKCKKNVTQIKFPGLSCLSCKNYFHASCVGISDIDLQGLVNSEASWHCTVCRSKSTGRRSIIIPPKQNKTPNNKTLNNSINGSWADQVASDESETVNQSNISKVLSDLSHLKSSFTSFQESVNYFSEEIDSFKTQIGNVESLLSRVMELEKSNNDLTEKTNILTDKVNRLEQASLAKDLILCGVPLLENDNYSLYHLTTDFLNTFNGVSVRLEDLSLAVRLGPASSNSRAPTKPPKVLVKFHSTKLRDSIKHFVRNCKKTSRTVKFNSKDVDFYVAENLTPYYNQLLYSVKDYARNNNFFKAWVSNSVILLKKTKDSVPVKIRSLSDLPVV